MHGLLLASISNSIKAAEEAPISGDNSKKDVPEYFTLGTDLEDPKAYTISGAVGSSWFLDGIVEKQFEPWSMSWRIQAGRQFFNQLQLQMDVYHVKDKGYNFTVDGTEQSDDETTLRLVPFNLGVSYRFDYVSEQAFVPYISSGATVAWLNLSSVDVDDNEVKENGHRIGGYVGGGLEILLDRIEPSRAADLEISSHINDTYLVLDARYNWLASYLDGWNLKKDDTLRFNGFLFTVGLKFDF